MIEVYVPYTKLHPVVETQLWRYRQTNRSIEVCFDLLDDGDEDAYRKWLQNLWDFPRDLVIIEQDVLPWPGAIEELAGCPAAWCTLTYYLHGGYGIAHALGCSKISGEIMRLLPDVWSTPRRWSECDGHLFHVARAQGWEPHLHRPPAIHLSDRHDVNGVRPDGTPA